MVASKHGTVRRAIISIVWFGVVEEKIKLNCVKKSKENTEK